MTEQGKIIKIKKNEAVVRINRKSACAGCGMCAMKPQDLFIDISLLNTLDAKLGDIVLVDVTSGSVAKMSITAYLIPLLVAVLGLFVGVLFSLPEWADVLLFFVGMSLGFFIVSILDKKVFRRSENMPKMIEICTKAEKNENMANAVEGVGNE